MWLSISAGTLRLTAPAALLALVLHGAAMGGGGGGDGALGVASAAEAAACTGAVFAAATEAWKVLEGYQG